MMGCFFSNPKTIDNDFDEAKALEVKRERRNLASMVSLVSDSSVSDMSHAKIQPILPPPKGITSKEMSTATDGFSEKKIIGEGTFGIMYRGVLKDPAAAPGNDKTIVVAVKKLHRAVFSNYKNYLNEVILLNDLRHPNLVRLVAYSHTKETACLAYEYCSRGSLESALAQETDTCIPWKTRVEIAADVARGLSAMHEHNIIHRDLKSSNVLLNFDYGAKVTDFALAHEGPNDKHSHVSTKVLGTLGYLDPVYMETGRLSLKSDVYAFGVIVLEIITGRPSVEGVTSLVQKISPHLNQNKPNIFQFVDPSLKGDFSKRSVNRMALIARACLNGDPEYRPSMMDVLSGITKCLEADDESPSH